MSQEVLEIVEKMNSKALETQFILQCAPMLASLKISNLLIIRTENVSEVERILEGTDISYICLARGKRKTAMLIYHEHMLFEYLSGREVRQLLCDMGYGDVDNSSLLCIVQKKYEAYTKNAGHFPHELGLLLGYPAEDVKGYMVNKGRNSLYTGYWQVYENPKEKINLFRKYELAKEHFIRLISQGVELTEIVGNVNYNSRNFITI